MKPHYCTKCKTVVFDDLEDGEHICQHFERLKRGGRKRELPEIRGKAEPVQLFLFCNRQDFFFVWGRDAEQAAQHFRDYPEVQETLVSQSAYLEASEILWEGVRHLSVEVLHMLELDESLVDTLRESVEDHADHVRSLQEAHPHLIEDCFFLEEHVEDIGSLFRGDLVALDGCAWDYPLFYTWIEEPPMPEGVQKVMDLVAQCLGVLEVQPYVWNRENSQFAVVENFIDRHFEEEQ